MSAPSLLRPQRAGWWPDWRGQTVVIAASGPSQNKADLDFVRGKARVIALNRTHELAPWADVLYSAGATFWPEYKPKFAGLMVAGNVAWPDAVYTDVKAWLPACGQLHNSGAQAIVFAECWGAARIILTGFDMQGRHWHPDHKTANPFTHFPKWIDGLGILANEVKVPIINCSRETAVECFPKARLEEVI